MKFVLAPDSFKGSLSSKQVCDFMSIGIKKALPSARIVKVPMADGGDGTLETLVNLYHGHYINCDVMGPLGNIVNAKYGLIENGQAAVISMAEASGIDLVNKCDLNPLKATSYGTGQLILDAAKHGVKRIYIGLGGSATNDGGQGMAKALGVAFFDKNGNDIGLGNSELSRLGHINIDDINSRIKNIKFTILSDVKNPLTGDEGASVVFGPQKGASTPDLVSNLDNNLKLYAEVIFNNLGVNVDKFPGAGAAGGMGAAFLAFFNSGFVSGADFIIQKYDLKSKLLDCDYVFTGEGSIDSQTAYGKVTSKVTHLAKLVNPKCKVIGLGGIVANDIKSLDIDAVFSITNGAMSIDESMQNASNLIINLSKNIAYLIK
ncbi:glycerate kinase [Apilactobacillus ozensis]|nr:glycerate kinase [Apilactobacillus ozensis]